MAGSIRPTLPKDDPATEPGGLTVDYMPRIASEQPTEIMPASVRNRSNPPRFLIEQDPGEDLSALRRSRLLAAVGFFLFLVVPLRFIVEFFFVEGFSFRLLFMSMILADVFVLLLWKRMISSRWLTVLESLVFISLALGFAWRQYEWMRSCVIASDPIEFLVTLRLTAISSMLLTFSYVIFIPSPWKRATRMILILSAFPLFTQLLFALNHPEISDLMRQVTLPSKAIDSAVQMIVTMALAIYGSYVMNGLRRDAFQALRLNQYRLGRRLGSGGMGEVYLAEHQMLKRPCAIKVILPGKHADQRAILRFEREVRAAAKLSHPNTIEIYDYGQTDNGTFYYVMEYLPGLSLAGILERYGALPPGRVVYLLKQAAEALIEAHACGLIHRDIKPGNIFAAKRGGRYDVAKLLDFGLVKELNGSEQGPALSIDQSIRGTPLYMAPEQATGKSEIDHRVDIYALGATAYELLTGSPPFDAPTRVQLFAALARDDAAAPSLINSNIPSDLDDIVLKCLSKDPDNRYRSAESLARALHDCSVFPEWSPSRAEAWWNAVGLASEESH